jgi:hypothetical protein
VASDPNQRTLFRKALQKALSEQLRDESGGKYDVRGRMLDSPQERDIACVWWDRKQPHAKAILEENFYGVRVFRRFKQDQGGEEPAEAQDDLLETTAEALEAALKAVLVLPWLAEVSGFDAAGDHDFFNVTSVLANHQGQYVEATIRAYATNRSGAGG